jgi:hypothetical protein
MLYPKGQHIFLRLTDGTEIVAEIDIIPGDDEAQLNGLNLKDPLELHYGHNEYYDGQVMYFSKFPYFTEDYSIFIPWENIIIVSEKPIKEMVTFYRSSLKKIKSGWIPLLNEEFRQANIKMKDMERQMKRTKAKDREDIKEIFESLTKNKKSIH